MMLSNRGQHASILVVVAGPSASGKSTFIKQLKRRNRPYLALRSLASIAIPPTFRFRSMGANPARKLIKRGESLVPKLHYRILHLDLTSDSRGKHLKFCPIVFSHFRAVHSIQLYLPYQEWRQRIQTRMDAEESISERVLALFELDLVNRRNAERVYRNIYAHWENYLDRNRIHSRCLIDPRNDTLFQHHPNDIRRNPLSAALHSVLCRMPILSAD